MPTPHTPTVPPAAGPHDRPGSRPTKGPTRVGAAPEAPGSSPRGDGVDLPMPHERDEAAGNTAASPDPVIRQAKRDLDAGLVDTDMRATPGLDAARRRSLTTAPPDPQGSGPSDAAVGPDRHDGVPSADRPVDKRRP